MTEPEKKGGPAERLQNPDKLPDLEEIQAAAKKLTDKWATEDPSRVKIAQEAGAIDDGNAVKAAVAFHKETGKYPWEVPASSLQATQREWLASSGIQPDAITKARIEELKKLIAAYQSNENGR